MKKSYIIPATLIVKVATTKIISASPLGNLKNEGGDVYLKNEKAESGSAGMSRGGSLWDDDDY